MKTVIKFQELKSRKSSLTREIKRIELEIEKLNNGREPPTLYMGTGKPPYLEDLNFALANLKKTREKYNSIKSRK
ncbi:hypothetical protein [Pedobacter nutrimenti]|nr:hypothetical protein [Pedobacter nutrimenti]